MRRTLIILSLGAALALFPTGCGGDPNVGGTAGGKAPPSPTTPLTTREGEPRVTDTTAPAPVPPPPPARTPTQAQPTTATQPPAACAETTEWGTGAKESERVSTAPIYLTRIGRHECYDRIVFDLNGTEPVGYQVIYVPVVTAGGSGEEVPVAGEAALQVVIRAPTQGSPGDASGHQPGAEFAPFGEYLHGPDGLQDWGALRAVRSAGWFEGDSTFAVGVRDRLPFRVMTWVDDDQIMHVTVDIAHY